MATDPSTSTSTSAPTSTPTAAPVGAELPDIPVTVIGGYLGSGKTTLVNHLLRSGDDRVAVLVNDFGDVDIDTDLIERDDGDTIALANGCICCSLVDGLAAALVTVTALVPRPDRVVIEASGVADPAAVAAYGHSHGLSLDAVVVLVDAETIRARAADKYVSDTVLGQLPGADIVVVNKVDLVEAAQVAAVVDWVRDRVEGALIVEATEAKVDPAILFGRVGPVGRVERVGEGDRRRDPGKRAGAGKPLHHRADDVFQSWSWTGPGAEGPVERAAVERLMADLPDSVVRAKGILWLPDGANVLQRVGRRWSLCRSRNAASGPSRLVVIGHRGAIDGRFLVDRLDSAGRA